MLMFNRTTGEHPPFAITGFYVRRIYSGRRYVRLLGYLRDHFEEFTQTLRGQRMGSDWIGKSKRLAIYLRDGLACTWCGQGVEHRITLTLDHLQCRCEGGDHDTSNLITSCETCNNRRGKRSVADFADAVGLYLDVDAQLIKDHIDFTRKRPVDLAGAVELLDRRGSISAAIWPEQFGQDADG